MPYKSGDTPAGRYRPCLVKLMNFKDHPHEDYTNDTVFLEEQLLAIVPTDVVRWLKFRAYGTPDLDADHDPLFARASSMLNWKKQLSHFMPNKAMVWDTVKQCGNPTKSTDINEFITKIKRKEARKQGAEPRKRRPMEAEEYERLIEMIEEKGGEFALFLLRYFQFSINNLPSITSLINR